MFNAVGRLMTQGQLRDFAEHGPYVFEGQLSNAAARGNLETVVILLNRGCDANELDGSPILWAVKKNHWEIAAALFEIPELKYDPFELLKMAKDEEMGALIKGMMYNIWI